MRRLPGRATAETEDSFPGRPAGRWGSPRRTSTEEVGLAASPLLALKHAAAPPAHKPLFRAGRGAISMARCARRGEVSTLQCRPRDCKILQNCQLHPCCKHAVALS